MLYKNINSMKSALIHLLGFALGLPLGYFAIKLIFIVFSLN